MVCGQYKDKATCTNKNECLWYESKSECYAGNAPKEGDGFGGNKAKKGIDANWNIVDEVIAPSENGEYILQWRWDNEQTPQIWTTCADIVVCDGCEPKTSGAGDLSIACLNSFVGILFWNLIGLAVAELVY